MAKKIIVIIIAIIAIIAIGLIMMFGVLTPGGESTEAQSEQLPEDQAMQVINALTEGNPDAVITVGLYENGEYTYHVYGEDGQELPPAEHTYAIGSVTKTFTGSLVAKAISEGKINNINDRISDYVTVANPETAPTFQRLVTHTSGLSTQWEEALMKDQTATFDRAAMIELLNAQKLKDKSYDAEYSNFGTALAGTAAAEVYDGTYEQVMNDFIHKDLGLENTKVAGTGELDNIDVKVGGTGSLDNYWPWQKNDEMMAAGAITSTVSDMLKYGKMHMDDESGYLAMTHEKQAKFDDGYDIGFFWLTDNENDIIMHNGEVEMDDDNGNPMGFQSFLGYSKSKQRVVVVLSNVIARDDEDNDFADLIGCCMLCE